MITHVVTLYDTACHSLFVAAITTWALKTTANLSTKTICNIVHQSRLKATTH